MQVDVCGLYTSSPPIELPTQLLNTSRITFRGMAGDRMGRKHESPKRGLQMGIKVASFAANSLDFVSIIFHGGILVRRTPGACQSAAPYLCL